MENLLHRTLPTTHARQTAAAAASAMFAVVLFAMTVPMTHMALAEYSPMSVAAGRTGIAGILALAVVLYNGWRFPVAKALPWLVLTGIGVVIGFPYLVGLALEHVPASNMGVVLAGLPLVTSLLATLMHNERQSPAFWGFSVAGCALLVFYMIHSLGRLPQLEPQYIGVMFASLLLGGVGYSAGARAAKIIGGWQTICWTLVIYLPITGSLMAYQWIDQEHAISISELVTQPSIALLYLAVFSQLWGFKFWYQALASAGVGKICQLQLLQPFFTLGFIAILFNQSISLDQLMFCAAIVLCVLASMTYARK